MKLLTLNTWGKYGPYEKRFPVLVRECQKEKPDFIGLQEVIDSELSILIQTECSLPYAYPLFRAGLLILSRYPLTFCQSHLYKTQSPHEADSRHVIFAKITLERGAFWLANTHLSWRPEDDEIRTGQAKEMMNILERLDAPAIAVGDFNCTAASHSIQTMLQGNFTDVYRALNPVRNGFTWDNDHNYYLKTHSMMFPNRRIDFILADRRFSRWFQIRKSELCFNESSGEVLASDHFGVTLEFS